MSNEKFESEIDDWMEELGSEENPFGEEDEVNAAAQEQVEADQSPGDALVEESPIDQAAIDALTSDEKGGEAKPKTEEEEPIDQAAIDALTSGEKGGEAKPKTEEEEPTDQAAIGALMGDGEDDEKMAEPKTGEEDPIDQADIDALMGGGGEDEKMAEPKTGEEGPIDQADIDALMGGGEDDGADSDSQLQTTPVEQSDIDALLEGAEVDQSDLDALLDDSEPKLQADSGLETEDQQLDDDIGVDQSELDELLDDSAELAVAPSSSTPSQTEIDELFSQNSSEDSQIYQTNYEQDEEEDGFDFAGDELSEDTDTGSNLDEMTPSDDLLDEDLQETVFEEPSAKKKLVLPVWIKQAAGNRAVWTGLSLCLAAIILGTTGYFTFVKKDRTPAIPVSMNQIAATVESTTPLQQTPSLANTPPKSLDMELSLESANAKELAIELAGKDPEGDKLSYFISSLPTDGRLLGDPPHLIYTPSPNFSGEDSFEYRTSDGNTLSPPGTVLITGQARHGKSASGALSPEELKILEPRMPLVKAVDLSLETLSTSSLNIDWRPIWNQTNDSSFSRKVSVEIIGKPKRGTLARLSRSKHKFMPDPYGKEGIESLSYRFNLAGIRSKTRQLKINVIQGDPPPALRISPLGKELFAVGDNVLLDASGTKDDDPSSLTFSWRQLAGVPMQLEILDEKGSMVSCMVPSSFYTASYPKPVIMVTVSDRSGQKASKKITINAGPSKQSVNWSGIHGQGLARLERLGPTPEILPWSYR